MKACLNGGRRPGDHPGVPVTPAALAREAAAAVRAGARAVHLHVRDSDGTESLDAPDVRACVAAVHAAVPGVPVGVSTGAWITAGDADRRASAVAAWATLEGAARPDFASVNLCEDGALELWRLLDGLGIGVEAGVWSASDLDVLTVAPRARSAVRVLLEVVDVPPGEELALARSLLAAARAALPADVPLLLHGEDAGAWPVLRLAALERLQTRIGLEDVLTGPRGEPVTGNADLVRAAIVLSASEGS